MFRHALVAAAVSATVWACVPADPDPDATTIPAALQGRWGLTANDCQPGRADAKGLMEVGPTTLKFYESTGTLAAITDRGDSRISGRFAYTGEGMTWEHSVTLRLLAEGGPLQRIEDGEVPVDLQYARCP